MISIHALRVEGDNAKIAKEQAQKISIHALRVEGDLRRADDGAAGSRISIHALRVEGDCRRSLERFDCLISIHALRVEGDLSTVSSVQVDVHFYPRPPGGGRRDIIT